MLEYKSENITAWMQTEMRTDEEDCCVAADSRPAVSVCLSANSGGVGGVVSKQESLADVAEETEENLLADIPSGIQEDRIDLTDRLTVEMDAQITVPQEGKLCVARLTRLGCRPGDGGTVAERSCGWTGNPLERTLADPSVQELTEAIDVISSTGEYPVRLYHMDGLDVSGKDAAISCLQGYLENAPAEPNYRYFTSGDPELNRTLEFDGAPDFAVCLASVADGQRALLYSCYNSQAPDGVVIGLDQQEAFGVTISVDSGRSPGWPCPPGGRAAPWPTVGRLWSIMC